VALSIEPVLTLYDADRCPYCARVRIVLAEKGLEHETVVVDLDDRPAWIYEKNPLGKVPVLEEDDFVLPESAVINEYLEERYPAPPLWPADPAERARGRLLVDRFDRLSRPYYALRRGDEAAETDLREQFNDLDSLLASQPYLTGREFGLADAAYLPWILRAHQSLSVDLEQHSELSNWVARSSERPSVAAELELLAPR
jgi:stringent starvation protein A